MSNSPNRRRGVPRASEAERIRRLLVIRPPPLPAIRIKRNGWRRHSAIPPRVRPLRALLRLCWRSITFCRIAGVPVRIHTTCLLYPIGFLAWLVWSGEFPFIRSGGLPAQALAALLVLDVMWGSLLLHEFAHILVARRSGIGTRSVVFIPFGAAALFDRPPRNTRDLWIAAAGPAVSFALAGCFWLASHAFPHRMHHSLLLPPLYLAVKFGCFANWTIALFNLIPCFPMDGGRILRSLLALVIGAFSRGEKSRVFELASRIVVRFVSPLVAIGVIAFTISVSHLWAHLVLFPLLLVAGEFEHRALQDDDDDNEFDDEPCIARIPRRLDDA